MGASVDASKKKDATREDMVKQYMPMFYITAITVAIFMILFYLLVPHDNPAAERARREQEKIKNVEVNGNSGSLNKWGQMKALMLNPRYLFLLVITLLVGYGTV